MSIIEAELKLPIKIDFFEQFFVITPDGRIRNLAEHPGTVIDWSNKVSQAQRIVERLSPLKALHLLDARQSNELYWAERVIDIDDELRNSEIEVIKNRIKKLES